MAQPPDVTGLLVAWSQGHVDANERLIEAVYAELRGLARATSGASVPTIHWPRRRSCARRICGSWISAACSGTTACTYLRSRHT